MSQLWQKIKALKPSEVTVECCGQTLLIRGMTRAEKNELVASCTNSKGKLDNDLLECKVLARCVCDPETGEPAEVDYRQWNDVPADFAGPLVSQCIKLCGFDDTELVRVAEKKSEATGSSD